MLCKHPPCVKPPFLWSKHLHTLLGLCRCWFLFRFWLPSPDSPEAYIDVMFSVPNLTSELGDINMDFFHRPAQEIGSQCYKAFSILRQEDLSKPANLFEFRVRGPRVQGTLFKSVINAALE